MATVNDNVKHAAEAAFPDHVVEVIGSDPGFDQLPEVKVVLRHKDGSEVSVDTCYTLGRMLAELKAKDDEAHKPKVKAAKVRDLPKVETSPELSD